MSWTGVIIRLLFHLLALLFALNGLTQNSPGREDQDPISIEAFKRHVEFLGSDARQGRGTGTEGGAASARYIASYLEECGLIPAGDRGTYFQSIPMHGSVPLPASRLLLASRGGNHDLQLERDYLLYSTGAQTFIPEPVPLAFVGYGISAPEFDYNDYQGFDVEGKVVVFLSGEPVSEDPSYFNGPDPTIHSYAESKQRIAISRGALGSVMIPTPSDMNRHSWKRRVNSFTFEHVTLAYSVAGNLNILMNPDAADQLFKYSTTGLADVLEMHRSNRMKSFPLQTKLSFSGIFEERDFIASNVVGLLKGKNEGDDQSFLLVSAHYDHLGIGMAVDGDGIYNGVFDNAVGVAAVMEIARVCAALKEKPQRSMIFLFTTGEEKGLLGSTYYVDHPVVPLHRTIANVNVDGLAMFDTFKDIIGVGAELSSLGRELEVVAGRMGLRVSPMPPQFSPSQSFARSDQIAFAKAGIPAVLVAEGTDYRHMTTAEAVRKLTDWNRRVYETPFDDLRQPMNHAAARQHCRILLEFCLHLAGEAPPPEWHPGSQYAAARLRSIAEKR